MPVFTTGTERFFVVFCGTCVSICEVQKISEAAKSSCQMFFKKLNL